MIANSSGRTWIMEHSHPVPGIVPRAASNRDYAPGFTVDLMCKDLGLAVNAARELRVPVAVSSAAQQVLRMASSHGYGRKDVSAVYAFLQASQARRARLAPGDGRTDATVNIARALEAGGASSPDQPAILFEGRRLTYRELDRAASRTAHGLARRGVGPGDRVALFLPNIPAFAIAYQAVQKLGAIVVSASAMLTTEELAALLEDSGAGIVFTVEALWPRVAPLVGDLVRRDRIVICEGEVAGLPTLDELGAGQPDELRAREMDPSAPAAILFTSGTTGRQKGATLSHANIAVQRLRGQSLHAHGPRGPPAGDAAALPRRGPERADERRASPPPPR